MAANANADLFNFLPRIYTILKGYDGISRIDFLPLFRTISMLGLNNTAKQFE